MVLHAFRRFDLEPVLADCCLDIGYLAQDTIGNAEETRAWAQAWGFRRIVVVTSNYHMPRSLLELLEVVVELPLQRLARDGPAVLIR